MVLVRKMKVEDIEASVKVVVETMEDTWNRYEKECYPREALEFDVSQQIPEKYIKGIEEPNDFYFVAEEKGGIVGIAIGTFLRGHEKAGGLARLRLICVHSSHQGKGTGKALLNHVIEFCKQQKCHKITLYTLPVLIPALNLYFKLGFVPEAYLRKEWWETDFIKMSKWL